MADAPAAPDPQAIVIVTGLEGPVEAVNIPVTCSYCQLDIVKDDDHATNCPWHPGKATAQ